MNNPRNYPSFSTISRTVKQSSIGTSISGQFQILLCLPNLAHSFSGVIQLDFWEFGAVFIDHNVLLSRDGVAYLKLGDTK